ncbi:hypothetical protein LP419_17295 [Massilia sp. H-1]|nr:hypothetical protein LP419_17295 [Massilia sp. H-1]
MLPDYERMYGHFGTELPLFSQLLMRHHVWFWVLPVGVIAVRLFWPRMTRRSEMACGAGVASFILALICSIVAGNLPFWMMAPVV